MGELEVGHRRFGGGERAKEGRLGETGTRFCGAILVRNWPRWEATRERAWVEKTEGQWPPLFGVEVGPDFPEMAIGCLNSVGMSDEPETHQSSSRPRSRRGARWERAPRFY